MFCENCGKQVQDGFKFCVNCGTPVPESAAAEEKTLKSDNSEYCESCGKKLVRGYEFCMECGTPVPKLEKANVDDYTGKTDVTEAKSSGDGESLVFCDKCGLHLQSLKGKCEKCGAILDAAIYAEEIGAVQEQPTEPKPYVQPEAPIVEETPVYAEEAQPQNDNVYVINSDNTDSSIIDEYRLEEKEPVVEEVEEAPEVVAEPVVEKAEEALEAVTEPVVAEVEEAPEAIAEPVVEEVEEAPEAVAEPVVEEVEEAPEAVAEPVVEEVEDAPEAVAEPVIEEVVEAPEAVAEPVVEEIEEAPEVVAEPVVEEVEEAPEAVAEPVVEEVEEAPEAIAEPVVEEVEEAPEAVAEPVDAPAYIDEERKPTAPIDEYVAPVEPERKRTAPIDEYVAPVEPRRPETPSYKASADDGADIAPDLGKLTYCRNCGQDMYEKETVCKNCGSPPIAPRKRYRPKNTVEKEKKRPVFGILSIPQAACGGIVIAAVVILIVFTSGRGNNGKDLTSGGERLEATTSASTEITDVSAAIGDPAETSAPVTDTEPAETPIDTITNISEPTSEETLADTDDETVEPVDATPEETTRSSPQISTASQSPQTSQSPTGTTASPNTTTPYTTVKPVTTTAAPTVDSATVKAENAYRDQLVDAFVTMAGEVGKINYFAFDTISAMEDADANGSNTENARITFYDKDYSKKMISSIKSGKSTVDTLMNSIKTSSTELGTKYTYLKKLYDKYVAYYNFIIKPSGKLNAFTSSCDDYYSDFNDYMNSNLAKHTYLQTTNQSTAQKNAVYVAAFNDAISSATNCKTYLQKVVDSLSGLSSTNFGALAKSSIHSTDLQASLAKAATYEHEVYAYYNFLRSAPSEYSTAYNNLVNVHNEIEQLISAITNSTTNSLANFKKETKAGMDDLTSSISNAKNGL